MTTRAVEISITEALRQGAISALATTAVGNHSPESYSSLPVQLMGIRIYCSSTGRHRRRVLNRRLEQERSLKYCSAGTGTTLDTVF